MKLHEPSRVTFNDVDYFFVDFLDYNKFLEFVRESHKIGLGTSPYFEMSGDMTDAYGNPRYNKDTVNKVVYCLVSRNILVRYFDLKEGEEAGKENH